MSEHVEVEREYSVGDTIDISFILESGSLPVWAKVVVTFSHQDDPTQQIVLSKDLLESGRQVQFTHEILS